MKKKGYGIHLLCAFSGSIWSVIAILAIVLVDLSIRLDLSSVRWWKLPFLLGFGKCLQNISEFFVYLSTHKWAQDTLTWLLFRFLSTCLHFSCESGHLDMMYPWLLYWYSNWEFFWGHTVSNHCNTRDQDPEEAATWECDQVERDRDF